MVKLCSCGGVVLVYVGVYVGHCCAWHEQVLFDNVNSNNLSISNCIEYKLLVQHFYYLNKIYLGIGVYSCLDLSGQTNLIPQLEEFCLLGWVIALIWPIPQDITFFVDWPRFGSVCVQGSWART